MPSAKAKPRCFMITPIGGSGSAVRKHADWVFKFMTPVCSERHISLERADRMVGSSMITSRIFEAISSAEFAIADLTGLNPNVLYEVGVRHTLLKPVVHIASVGTELPFDNAQHDTIFFDLSDPDSMDALATKVGEQLDGMAHEAYRVSNPLTHALGAVELVRSGDSRDQIIAQLVNRLDALESDARGKRLDETASPTRLILEDLLLRLMREKRKQSIQIDPEFARQQIGDIPPWRESDAQDLVNLILKVDALENRSELIDIVRERFPGIIPF